MRVTVNDLGKVGVVKDVYSTDIPPEGWTEVRNARMGPYGVEAFLGHEKTLNTAAAAWTQQPMGLFYAPVPGSTGFWIGAGLTKVYVRQAGGSFTESEITRLAGVYAATTDKKWQGNNFGGAFVLNNGVDEPQFWSPIAGATRLVNLSTLGASPWPATYRCRVIRPFGRFLVAIDITKGAVRYAQLVKWSHPADPGTYPNSWNEADPATDAGEFPLADTESPLVDMLPIRNMNIIYSQDQVIAQRLVDDGNVFGFDTLFREQGCLATNCVSGFKKDTEYHAVLGGDDIFIHNGQAPLSIVTPAMRRWFFNQIDPTNFQRSFVVTNPIYSEIWVCVPQIGATQPTLALVWNWEDNAIGFRDLLQVSSGTDTRTTSATQGTPSIALGYLEDTTLESWASDLASWDSDTTAWNTRSTSPVVARLLMADMSAGNRTFLLDSSHSFDGVGVSWFLERQGIALMGQTRDGRPVADMTLDKLVTEVWPKVELPPGQVLAIQIGSQDTPDQPVAWGDTVLWQGAVNELASVYISGRILSIRFATVSTAATRLLGYGLEIEPMGNYN